VNYTVSFATSVSVETRDDDRLKTPGRTQRPTCSFRPCVTLDPLLGDGRVAGTPGLAVAKDVIEPNLYLSWPAHADGISAFYAKDFNLAAAIAPIIVVQNLPRL
jgi:hypothetical protein